MTEEEVLTFVRASLSSTWELELLFLLFRTPDQRWTAAELVRELRASQEVIARAVHNLAARGLIIESQGHFGWGRGNAKLDELMASLQLLSMRKPFTVFRAMGKPDR